MWRSRVAWVNAYLVATAGLSCGSWGGVVSEYAMVWCNRGMGSVIAPVRALLLLRIDRRMAIGMCHISGVRGVGAGLRILICCWTMRRD